MARIITALAMFPAAYLFGAFVAADWDFTNWDGEGRFFIAMLAIGAALAALTFPRFPK